MLPPHHLQRLDVGWEIHNNNPSKTGNMQKKVVLFHSAKKSGEFSYRHVKMMPSQHLMKEKLMKNIIAGLFAMVAMAGSVQAQNLSAALSTWEVITEVQDDGTIVEYRTDPENIIPQDRVEVIATLSNTSEEMITSISFVLDIDPSLTIEPASLDKVVGHEYVFATEQAPDFYGDLSDLTITEADGSERPARADDLISVRVKIAEIPPAKNVTFGYTAVVQ